MSWAEVKKINNNLDIPLNHSIWLNEYEQNGKNGYVYQNEKIFKELVQSGIWINGSVGFDDLWSKANESGQFNIGMILKHMNDAPSDVNWSELKTYDDIVEYATDGVITLISDKDTIIKQLYKENKYKLLEKIYDFFVRNGISSDIKQKYIFNLDARLNGWSIGTTCAKNKIGDCFYYIYSNNVLSVMDATNFNNDKTLDSSHFIINSGTLIGYRDNDIYLIGNSYDTTRGKYVSVLKNGLIGIDMSTENLPQFPIYIDKSRAITFTLNNTLYVLFKYGNLATRFFKLTDDKNWEELNNLPELNNSGDYSGNPYFSSVVINNIAYIVYKNEFFSYDGENWTKLSVTSDVSSLSSSWGSLFNFKGKLAVWNMSGYNAVYIYNENTQKLERYMQLASGYNLSNMYNTYYSYAIGDDIYRIVDNCQKFNKSAQILMRISKL